MLSIFGYFEKSINQKDSIYVDGQYQGTIRNVAISFPVSYGNRVANSTNPSSMAARNTTIITICYCFGGATLRVGNIAASVVAGLCFCENTFIYGSSENGGSGVIGGGSGSGSSGGSGGSGGGGSPPPVYQCPPSEWWCESGQYRIISGVLYTSDAYPGKELGLPWAWWETNNFSTADLPMVFLNVEMLGLNLVQAQHLISNSSVNVAVSNFLIENENSDEAKNVAKACIDQFINNGLNDFGGIHHVAFIQQNITNCCPVQLIALMSAKTAFIQLEHPDWSYARCYLEAYLEIIHDVLDGVGLVPVVGEVADVANGIIYTVQGQGVNAALSFAATIPIAGWAATGAKWARKVITLSDGTKAALNWYKRTDGLISFGKPNSSQFRKLLGLAAGDPRQAHHIIPWELCDDIGQEVIQKAASARFPFHVQDILNGIPLTSAQHLGSLPQYTERVKIALQKIKDKHGANLTPEIAYHEIVDLTNRIKAIIAANPNISIENIIF